MTVRAPEDVGVLYVVDPLPLSIDDLVATNVPVDIDEWDETVAYKLGQLVQRNGIVYQAALEKAVTYETDCDTLYNVGRDPADPDLSSLPLNNECLYRQAGAAWWVTTDPLTTYISSVLNFNVYDVTEISGDMTITVYPKEPFDTVFLAGLKGERVSLNDNLQDLYLFDREHPSQPFGPKVTHADQAVFLFDELVTCGINVNIEALSGRSALGTIALGRRVELGAVNYQTTVGIVDYSQKRRNLLGRMEIEERGYQHLTKFLLETTPQLGYGVKTILTELRNRPAIYIGHDNPARRELHTLGILRELSYPIESNTRLMIDVEIESVGVADVPGLVEIIAAPPNPQPACQEVVRIFCTPPYPIEGIEEFTATATLESGFEIAPQIEPGVSAGRAQLVSADVVDVFYDRSAALQGPDWVQAKRAALISIDVYSQFTDVAAARQGPETMQAGRAQLISVSLSSAVILPTLVESLETNIVLIGE